MEATRLLVTEKIGPNTGWTDEKFLICYSVPIARTGILLYGPNERPEIPAGPDGLIRIERDAEDVFERASIESLQGKDLVNEHPMDVNPDNYQELTVGTILNPRRGEGVYDDCIVADIIVKQSEAIQDVLAGKREVSAGYDCKYFDLGNGRGRQTHIRFNHVALVESGRCGPRCSIKDHAMRSENMAHKWLDKARNAFTSQDKRTFDEALEEAEKETKDSDEEREAREKAERETHDRTHDDDLNKRMEELEARHKEHADKLETHDAKLKTHDSDIEELKDKVGAGTHDEESEEEKRKREEAGTKDADKEIEGELKEEAPEGAGDKAMKAKDSAYLLNSYQHTIAMAEIIAPGIKIPTFDGKSEPKATYRDICKFRKRALSLGLLTMDTANVIETIRGGRTLNANTLDEMPCRDVRNLFFATAAAKKAANTHDATSSGSYTNTEGAGGGLGVVGSIKTPAEINQINKTRFGGSK